MILFVDAEHEQGFDKPWGEALLAGRTRITYRLEDITGDTCLLQRYTRVSPDLVDENHIRAMFISGSGTEPDVYDPVQQEGLRNVVREAKIPIFGFCGGLQLMAETLGADLGQVGQLEEGEEDPDPEFMPGWRTETGYRPVEPLAEHPVLTGLSPSPVFRHFHGLELKTLPTNFSNYARTETTENQLAIHDTLPLAGTQFHPEYYTHEHPDGRLLIENFCRWSGII